MPQKKVKPISTHCLEDSDHASDKVTRRSQTGNLVLCNRALVMWLDKKQNSVETSNFGSKFTVLKLAVELVIYCDTSCACLDCHSRDLLTCSVTTRKFSRSHTPHSPCCERNITASHIINAERLLPPSFVALPRKTPRPTWQIYSQRYCVALEGSVY